VAKKGVWLIAHGSVAAIALLIAAATFLTRGMYVQIYLHDYFFVTDIAWRSAVGQIPHVDFPSSIGQAFYWPFQVIAQFTQPTATAVLYANLLVAAVLMAGAVPTLRLRLSPLLYVLAVAAIIGTPIAARNFDHIWTFSFLAPYNRWSWALVLLVALIALVPPRRPNDRPANVVDGVVLGLSLALLAYLKVNQFLGAAALLLVGLLVGHLTVRVVALAVAVALCVATLVEITFHNNLLYVRDLMEAVRANAEGPVGNVTRPAKLLRTLVLAGLFSGALLAIIWLWTPARPLRALRSIWGKPLLLALISILIGVFISYQNFDRYAATLYIAATIVLAELGRRRLAEQQPEGRPAAPAGPHLPVLRDRLAWLGVIAAAGVFTLLDIGSFTAHMIASRTSTACQIPALRGTPLANILQTPASVAVGRPFAPEPDECSEIALHAPRFRPEASEPYEDLAVPLLSQAMGLLRQHARRDDRILALQFSNMFPAALQTPPVRGALPWWHVGRSFSKSVHPDPEALLAETTLVLQSTAPGDWNDKGQPLWPIYRPAIQKRFVPVAQTEHWTLWRRRDTLG
jgi:hypothetical protein